MSLGKRKLMVLLLLGTILLISNIFLVANWLTEQGILDWARHIGREYLTGTAVTIIVVLLVLLVSPKSGTSHWLRRCPVCDHRLLGRGNYCPDCGSRIGVTQKG